VRILLDTQCWLWWLTDPDLLRDKALEAISSADNEVYLSAASSWEISIKWSIKKLSLPQRPSQFVPSRLARDGFLSLPVEHVHALHVAELPLHHRDPFDRILIAQAQIEQLVLVTADPLMRKYDVELLVVNHATRI
jgi:PIN domain nuclease of toxin-antitoxin system